MKRYYFYKPSNYRKPERRLGMISFELMAYFSEEAYLSSSGKVITRFNELDKVVCIADTKNPGFYNFQVDHGKDGAHGHWAKNYEDFLKDKTQWGYIKISENAYFRFRKLALRLLYQHTDFNRLWTGRNDYFFNNQTRSFYDITLVATHYHHNLRHQNLDFRRYMNSLGYGTDLVMIAEQIKLHIYKPEYKGDKFESYSFSIQAARHAREYTLRYASIEAALESTTSNKSFQSVTLHQYERLRKIAKMLMFEHDELDISTLLKKQDFRIRILD